MSTITVISSVNLAAPEGGAPLPANVPAQVDGDDSFIRGLLEAGMITQVDGPAEVWDPEHPAQGQVQPTGVVHTMTPVSADAGDAMAAPVGEPDTGGEQTSEQAPTEEWT